MSMLDTGANVVIAATAFTGSIASVATLGWWLSGRFRKSEDRQRAQLDTHEEKDQERHDENLERFRLVSVGLARLGYTNGAVVKPVRARKK